MSKSIVKMDSALAKFMSAAKSFASEIEVEKVRARTREALSVKAGEGLVVGGRCFGYDNHKVIENGNRVRTEYVINKDEAAIVRQIFHWYVKEDYGLKRIARALNEKGVRRSHLPVRLVQCAFRST